jgi:phosphohistidine phosphatase
VDLILWRHAEAHDALPGQDDLARELTAKGERQAQRVAAWLNRHLPETTRVLVSPAARTVQTAAALDRRAKPSPALAPDQGVEALLAACRWPDGKAPVLIVGHQPTLGLAAAWLLAAQVQPWPLRKGAFVWLRGREREGHWQVVLHAALGPELA